jgi:hypothetical protein
MLRNFAFRIGVLYIQDHEKQEYRSKNTSMSPEVTVTHWGDGDVSIQTGGDLVYRSQSLTTIHDESSKRFTFGVGYQHSENLNIDLSAYMQEDEAFFTGLSFTVHI